MSHPSRTPAFAAAAYHLDDLLQRTARGDRIAFAELYRTSAPQLFGLALRMVRQRDVAEELLQEAFVLVWRKADGFDPAKGRALAWMASVLRNKCINSIRGRRPESSIETEPAAAVWADPAPGPMDQALLSADARALTRCMDQLIPAQRDAILLVYYEGLTHVELAERTAQPLGTLKGWIRRGLLRLRACLEE